MCNTNMKEYCRLVFFVAFTGAFIANSFAADQAHPETDLEKRQRLLQSLPFSTTYEWRAQVNVDMPNLLGGERRILHAWGDKTFEFYEMDEPNQIGMRLVDMNLILPETALVMSTGIAGSNWAEPITISNIGFGTEHIDLSNSQAFVDSDTGAFSLIYQLNVTPETVPLLADYGIDLVPMIVQEAGLLDIEDGNDFQSWLRFDVAPGYEDTLPIQCSGQKCSTSTVICATLDGSPCQTGGRVFICPGDAVYLWWQSSDDVAHAEISPGLGTVSPSGNDVVHPTSSTKYTITAYGECKRQSSVYVHVVQEGDKIDIALPPIPAIEAWQFELPKTRCSASIKVTSLKPKCQLGCFKHTPPIAYYPYMSCGSLLCNGLWSLRKDDPDGHIHLVSTGSAYSGPLQLNIPDWPLAGVWTAVPLSPPYQYSGYAYFELTVACR